MKLSNRMSIPFELTELLDDKPIGHIASVRPNGGPHLVPVWIGFDSGQFLVAGRRNKQRHVNVESEPRVALSVIDGCNHLERAYLIHGEVDELTPDGALEFLNQKAMEYLEVPEHPITDSDRLLMRITPSKILDVSADFSVD